MNLLSEIESLSNRPTSCNYETLHEEFNEKQSKIYSSRNGTRKKHMFIVSNQNTKMFPPDFFQNANDIIGSKSERSNSAAVTLQCFQNMDEKNNLLFEKIETKNKKLQDNDLEDERELLNLLNNNNDKSKSEVNINSNMVKKNDKLCQSNTKNENISPMALNKNKNIYDLKSTGFEMIPEEDEDRNRTEYESAKKFYDHKNKNNLRKSVTEGEGLKIIKEEMNNFLHREIIEKRKIDRDCLSPNIQFRVVNEASILGNNLNGFANNQNSRMKNIKGIHREKSQDSLSTFEQTNDIDKSKRASGSSSYNNEPNSSSSKKNIAHDIFDFSKVNEKEIKKKKENTIKESISNRNDKELFSPKSRTNIDSSSSSNVFSSRLHKTKSDLKETITAEAINTERRSQSNRTRKVQSFTSEIAKVNFKPQTPPEMTTGNKLPAITTHRRKIFTTSESSKSNYDIKNIFEAANGFKEDPIIKRKLDDIMQNIADIRNVLNQKTKTRLKMASAPTNSEESDFKSTFIGRTELNSANIILNKNKSNILGDKEKVRDTFKIASANTILNGNRKLNLNSGNNIDTANVLLNTNISNLPKDKSPMFSKAKDKLPIKLIKKDSSK